MIAIRFMEETFTLGKPGYCKSLERNDSKHLPVPQQGKYSYVPGSLDSGYGLNNSQSSISLIRAL